MSSDTDSTTSSTTGDAPRISYPRPICDTPAEITPFTSHLILDPSAVLELGVPEHEVAAFQQRAYQESFGVTSWIGNPELEKLTFTTVVVEASQAEAKALLGLCNEGIEELIGGVEAEDRAEREAVLSGLERRIDEVVYGRMGDEEEGEGGGEEEEEEEEQDETTDRIQKEYFVKLDTRSPKDAPDHLFDDLEMQAIVRDVFDDWVRQQYEQFEEGVPQTFEELRKRFPEDVYLLIKKAMIMALKVSSGKQTIKILTKSRRVAGDLARGLRFGDGHFKFRLIFREWIQHVVDNPQYEFRCFVHKGELTAVSQYFHDSYFVELNERRDEILETIQTFFGEISQHFHHESYVLDLFIGSSVVGPMVIEINPFHTSAGGCLFTWREDRELFLNGPLEFRLREKSVALEEEGGWKELTELVLIHGWKDFLGKTYGEQQRRKRCVMQ